MYKQKHKNSKPLHLSRGDLTRLSHPAKILLQEFVLWRSHTVWYSSVPESVLQK